LVLICIIIAITKIIIWCFFSTKDKYQEFENEKTVPVNHRGRSISRNSNGSNDLERFRQNELKGELDPQIFYKNEYSKENTGNHRVLDLKLDFENQTEENDKQMQLEAQNQSQIRKLNLEFDVSSR